jgi:Domain of unknown function (DUF4386)
MQGNDVINLDRTTATTWALIDSLRKTALVAGVIYLITFVSIPTLSLYGPVRNDPNYVLGPGPDDPILIGAILEVIVALACVGTAVVLYSVVKRQHEGIAMGFVGSRVLEAATIFVGGNSPHSPPRPAGSSRLQWRAKVCEQLHRTRSGRLEWSDPLRRPCGRSGPRQPQRR